MWLRQSFTYFTQYYYALLSSRLFVASHILLIDIVFEIFHQHTHHSKKISNNVRGTLKMYLITNMTSVVASKSSRLNESNRSKSPARSHHPSFLKRTSIDLDGLQSLFLTILLIIVARVLEATIVITTISYNILYRRRIRENEAALRYSSSGEERKVSGK